MSAQPTTTEQLRAQQQVARDGAESVEILRVALLGEIMRAEQQGVRPADVVRQLERCAVEVRHRYAVTSDPTPRSAASAQTSFVRRLGQEWAVILLYANGYEHVLSRDMDQLHVAMQLLDHVQSIGGRPAYIVQAAEYAPHPATGELKWGDPVGPAALTNGFSVRRVNRQKIMDGSVVYRSSWDWVRKFMLQDSRDVYSKGGLVGGAQPSNAV